MNITPGSNIGVGNKRVTGKEGRGRERINNMYVRVRACKQGSAGSRFSPENEENNSVESTKPLSSVERIKS